MLKSNLKLSLCRTCLVTVGQNNAFSIVNTVGLAQKLMLCTGMMLETTDVYPENVCPKCYHNILLLYEFQQMCCKSLAEFNELLKKQNTKIPGCPHFRNYLKEKSTESDPSGNVDVLKEFSEKKKRDRPAKKKMEDQRLKRKATNKGAIRSVNRKPNDTDVSKDEMSGKLTEYLQFDKESSVFLQIERISLNKEESYASENVYNKIKIEDIEMPDICADNDKCNGPEDTDEKYSADMESCSSSHEATSPKGHKHQCDLCSKRFSALYKLKAHIKQHADELPTYTCTLEGCERSFSRWHCYNKHEKEHDLKQEQRLKCDLENCERVYKNKSALNIHKRKFHNVGPELKTHMCEICGKVFKSSSVLNDHRYTHIDKKQLPFACEEEGCGKRFSNKEKLKTHNLRHAGIKNFICTYCGMRKTTRNELKMHINYHTLERTWACHFCPKVCNSAGNLKMHVKNVHERVKDFACRYCERTFAKADTKKYHEMTHTGEKPNECKECGRRFLQPAALRTHRKIHLRQKGNLDENRKPKVTTVKEEVENATTEILYDTNKNLH